MINIDFHFPPGQSAEVWSAKHACGDVPGEWLYGLQDLAKQDGVAVDASELRGMSRLERIKSIARTFGIPRRVLSTSNRDVLHLAWDELRATHMVTQNAQISFAMCGAIWCIDEQLRNPMDLRNFVIRHTLREMDAVWCLVAAQVPLLQQWLGSGAPPVHAIPFGIDNKFFSSSNPVGNSGLILSLGTDRDRDSSTLVRALERVLKERPDARALIQCPEGTRLPARAERLPYLPHREIRELIEEANVVLLPTRTNTHFSGMTVALEAMAMGRPVIATNTLGADEYIEHDVDGFLAESRDVDAFAALTLSVLDDKKLAERIGRAGIETVASRFTSKHMVDQLTRVITSLPSATVNAAK
ncbi:glycosyltransferase family 4 protein [Rhodococcus sp. MS16]|uniref:glycosyltransferase n=1 Tax=Rhodococcus sp. MS16 TaxID=2579941 RepID=UPI001562C6A2|nr:glycosyltransferase family 4 protein [Rhodococcus sp. MS16]